MAPFKDVSIDWNLHDPADANRILLALVESPLHEFLFVKRHRQDHLHRLIIRRFLKKPPMLLAEKDPDIFSSFVFQKMNQLLRFITLVEIEICRGIFNHDPSPESPACRVIAFQVEPGSGKAKITRGADDLFMFPKAVPATGAYTRENKANEIINKPE